MKQTDKKDSEQRPTFKDLLSDSKVYAVIALEEHKANNDGKKFEGLTKGKIKELIKKYYPGLTNEEFDKMMKQAEGVGLTSSYTNIEGKLQKTYSLDKIVVQEPIDIILQDIGFLEKRGYKILVK